VGKPTGGAVHDRVTAKDEKRGGKRSRENCPVELNWRFTTGKRTRLLPLLSPLEKDGKGRSYHPHNGTTKEAAHKK